MSQLFRGVIVGLVLAAIAFAGILYVGHRNNLREASSANDSGGIASLSIADLLTPRTADAQLVAMAFRQVERVYYKPVQAQTLLGGERTGLTEMLHQALHKNVALPALHATGDQTQDLHAMDAELASAQSRYASLLGPGGKTTLTQAAISGMLNSLKDPYTIYMPPDSIRALNEQLDGGNFGGVGVFIYQIKNEIVVQPIEGLPAARAGMKANEVVDRIDGTSTAGLSLDRVERMIRGTEGTTVTLGTHDYGKNSAHRFSIVREIIHVPTVHQKMENGYNYIRLSQFGETSADEIHKALLAGKAHGAKGTILDLRDNGGGLLDAAVNISGFFLPQGQVVVTEIDRQGNKDVQSARGGTLSGVTPLVILVNKWTASASEITSGALQDYHVATLVGTKTFGKGVVQGIYPMPNGGALKITTQRYVTPAGRDIQHKGIEPDIYVDQSLDPNLVDTPGDKQLQAAKAFLNRKTR